jgi:hypothetical protein
MILKETAVLIIRFHFIVKGELSIRWIIIAAKMNVIINFNHHVRGNTTKNKAIIVPNKNSIDDLASGSLGIAVSYHRFFLCQVYNPR